MDRTRVTGVWPLGFWQQRVTDLLLAQECPTVVVADRASGIDVVLAGLGTRAAPLVWVKFDSYDGDDEVSQGSKLSEAVTRAVGSQLFGHGLPLDYGIEIIVRFHDLVGPFTIVVSNAQYVPTALPTLLRLCDTTSRLVIVAETVREIADHELEPCVSNSDCLLSLDEALRMAEGLDAGAVERLLADADRKYVPFQVSFRRARSLPPLLIPEPAGASFQGADLSGVDPVQLISAFENRGAYAEAFELSVQTHIGVSDSLISRAGQHFFDRGLHRRFYHLLSSLGRPVRQKSDDSMRWFFSAATVVNEHACAKAEVQEYLMSHEAPELRALFVAAFPGPDLLEETARALALMKTPLTLRMHAFAVSQVVGGEDGVDHLMAALRQSEALGQDDLVMACATDLADFWVKRGSYYDAAEWAKWALDWHVSHSLCDEVRRLMALSLWCFARLLTGDTLAMQSVIAELDVSFAGVPTVESTVSTKGDWHFVNGELEEAARLYRLNLNSTQLGQFQHAAIDLVHCLVAMNQGEEALQLARRARMLTHKTDLVNRGLGHLAVGLASLHDPSVAMETLSVARGVVTEAYRLAQATIALAKLHLRQYNDEAVQETLAVGAPALRELGFTGWTLLGGFDPEVKALFQMFRGESNDLELHLLGGQRLVYRGSPLELGLRQCECLVVLAARPEGVTAERLGLDVYGESAHLSTLKAIVSRLRQAIPVDSKPYRIGVTTWADFVELERLLASGRVREAMSLYRGPLLPRSEAPAVVELREHLDESIRRAVLRSGDVEALLQLAKLCEYDLELYEAALERISTNDPRFPLVRARLEQVRRSWQQA